MRKIAFLVILTSFLISANPEKVFKDFKGNYPDAAAVYLFQNESFAWNGKLVFEGETLIKILNKTGVNRYSDLRLRKGKEKVLEVLGAYTLKKDLKRINVGSDSINKVTPPFLSDVPFYAEGIEDVIYSYPSVEPGDGLYIRYRKIGGESFSSVEYPMTFDPKESFVVKVLPPKGKELKYRYRNLELKRDGDAFIWSGKIPMLYPEEFTPPIRMISPFVIFSASKDWNEETEHLRNSFYKMLSRGKFEYKGEKSLEAIYKFITVGLRTVRLPLWYGGMDFTPLGKIEENGFADQRDKALVGVYILRKMGYEAYPVLVRNYVSPVKEVPTLSQFDAFVIMFRKDGEWIFMDPVDEYSTIGNLLYSGEGLVLKKKGVSWVKVGSVEENSADFLAKISLRKNGDFIGELFTTGKGFCDREIKQKLRYMKDDEKDKLFSTAADNFLAGSTSISWDIKGINSFTEEAKITQKLAGKELGIIQRGTDGAEVMIIKIPGNPYSFTAFPFKTSLPQRRYPLYIGNSVKYTAVFEIEIPSGWIPIFVPEQTIRESKKWKFSVTTEVKDGILKVEYTAELKDKLITVEEYPAFSRDEEILFLPSSKLVILKRKNP